MGIKGKVLFLIICISTRFTCSYGDLDEIDAVGQWHTPSRRENLLIECNFLRTHLGQSQYRLDNFESRFLTLEQKFRAEKMRQIQMVSVVQRKWSISYHIFITIFIHFLLHIWFECNDVWVHRLKYSRLLTASKKASKTKCWLHN